MSAALRKMLQSDEKRKQLTQALLENDLFTKRDPEEVLSWCMKHSITFALKRR